MSTGSLTPLSYVVLALVGERGAGAHDLVHAMRQGGHVYWGGAPSGLYSEPKRLAALGYLTARTEAGKTHPRTVYALTDPGLAGDMLTDAEIVASIRGMLPELDQLETLARDMYDQAIRVPHRARYLRLSHAYALRLVELHREWIAEIERELGT